MTRDEIMMLDLEALEKRAADIAIETADADKEKLETLSAELDAIEERKKAIIAENEETRRKAEAVAAGAGEVIEERKDDTIMPQTNKEIRNSQEYIEAFAKYIKTGKDVECRSLLTENVEGGMIPIPELVENTVRHAWESNEIWNRVRKTYLKGNKKVGFEISSTEAELHIEGDEAPDEEELVLGIVTMVPANIKKWITVSDEVMSLSATEFVQYVYDELAYRVAKKAADTVIEEITESPEESTSTAVGVPQIALEAGIGTVTDAEALLGGEAGTVVAIMSRGTRSAIKNAARLANYAQDPFDGCEVLITDKLDSYADASAGEVYMILGDMNGVEANLPNGDAIKYVIDDKSLAEEDLVKIVAKLYAAIRVTGPGMFVNIVKPGASE